MTQLQMFQRMWEIRLIDSASGSFSVLLIASQRRAQRAAASQPALYLCPSWFVEEDSAMSLFPLRTAIKVKHFFPQGKTIRSRKLTGLLWLTPVSHLQDQNRRKIPQSMVSTYQIAHLPAETDNSVRTTPGLIKRRLAQTQPRCPRIWQAHWLAFVNYTVSAIIPFK